MTNKEWLATLTAEQFYDEWKKAERQFCFDINTRLALIEWFDKKHDDHLKEQYGYVSVPFSWLVKFCSHIDFKEPLTDEEREKEWKRKLKQQFDIDV